MWKFSSALRQKSHLHHTTEEEKQSIRTRFKNEGLDENMPDDKKLPHVWRWFTDAELNWLSMKKQNEKLYKQQEADLKEVEEYIESLWKQSNSRLLELQNENQLLKQQIYKIKLSKPTEFVLDIVNNNKKNLILNTKQDNGDLLNQQSTTDQQKENKKSAFSNVKQMFIKNTNNNKDQNVNKQLNLENELRFMIDKCRQVENEKKRLETENENLVFKLNETLAICDTLESSKTNVQIARNSKSFYELRQATSDYRLNKLEKDKLTTSKTMNFKTINTDDKSTSGIDSSSSQDKENNPIKLDQLKENNVDKKQSNLNQDSGRDSSSTLTDSRESKDSREFNDDKELKNSEMNYLEIQNALCLMNAVRDECSILKKELISKEKQIQELQLKYDKRKARHREQMLKLKNHIERETKRWEMLFNKAKQKSNELDQNVVQSSNVHLVDSL